MGQWGYLVYWMCHHGSHFLVKILTSHLVYVWVWQKYADAQNISILAAITEIRYIKKNTQSGQKTAKSGQTLIMLRS